MHEPDGSHRPNNRLTAMRSTLASPFSHLPTTTLTLLHLSHTFLISSHTFFYTHSITLITQTDHPPHLLVQPPQGLPAQDTRLGHIPQRQVRQLLYQPGQERPRLVV